MRFTAPRGTRDVLPPESELWRRIVQRAEGLFALYGYKEIVLPVMESTDLFVKGMGEGSDIVQKEMFTFEDKGGRSLTLRPEGTAGVARAFVQHNLGRSGLPVKLYYKGPMFRHEKPQAGRYRQFHQLGVELIGSPHPLADAEVITLCNDFFRVLEVPAVELLINSVGDESCRPQFVQALRSFLLKREERLCPDCKRRLEINPLRVFDCKVKECRKALEGAPRVTDHLCEACATHLRSLMDYLQNVNIKFRLEPEMVRGLDYYTRTVFEFQKVKGGPQDTLAAGGRYDNLISIYGGEPTPSTGFSIGLERVAAMLKEGAERNEEIGVFVIAIGEEARKRAFSLVKELRDRNIHADMDFMERSAKAQMKVADREGYPRVVIIGGEEIEGDYYTFRDMGESSQRIVTAEELYGLLMEG